MFSFLDLHENSSLDNSKDSKDRRKLSDASEGEKEIAAFSFRLSEGKKLYLLDEPTHSLDKANREKLKDRVILLSKTALVIIVLHENEYDSIADKIIEFKNKNLKEIYSKKCGSISNKTTSHLEKNYKKAPWIKTLRKSLLPSIAFGIIHFFFFLFIFTMITSSTINGSDFLSKAIMPGDYLSIPYNLNEPKGFPSYQTVGNIVLSPSIPDDKKIHVSIPNPITSKTITLSAYNTNFNLPFVDEIGLPQNIYFANPSITSLLTLNNSSGIFSLPLARFKSDLFDPEKIYSQLDNYSDPITFPYHTLSSYNKRNNTNLTLKDDEILVPYKKEISYQSNFLKNTSFIPDFLQNKFVDMNKLYPDGVRIKGFVSSGEEETFGIISDKVAQEILDSLPKTSGLFVPVSKENIDSVISFISNNKLENIEIENISSERSHWLTKYESNLHYQEATSKAQILFIMSLIIIFLMLELSYFLIFYSLFEHDWIIFFSLGERPLKTLTILNLPHMVITFLTIIGGYIGSIISFVINTSQYGFVPSLSWQSIVLILGIIILSFLEILLLFKLKNKKIKI